VHPQCLNSRHRDTTFPGSSQEHSYVIDPDQNAAIPRSALIFWAEDVPLSNEFTEKGGRKAIARSHEGTEFPLSYDQSNR
jgi:hypothetical protein